MVLEILGEISAKNATQNRIDVLIICAEPLFGKGNVQSIIPENNYRFFDRPREETSVIL